MDSHEWNKIAGGVLGTILFVLVVRIAVGALFETEPPAKPGYVVEGVEEPTTAAGPAVAVAEVIPDWGTVLPGANVEKGHDISHRCEQCHDLTKGGPNKIGPNLYGVVDRARASHPGFDYSSAMKAKGGNWTYDELFKFLKSPQAYIEGTKMSFAGLRSPDDRINLIAYLRTNADSPAAIPAPNPKAAAPTPATTTGAAPAGGSAPATATTPGAAEVPGAPPPPATAPTNEPATTPTATPAATPKGGPPKKS